MLGSEPEGLAAIPTVPRTLKWVSGAQGHAMNFRQRVSLCVTLHLRQQKRDPHRLHVYLQGTTAAVRAVS
jgi:hypothetical protein